MQKNTLSDLDSLHGHRNLNETEHSMIACYRNFNAPIFCKITVCGCWVALSQNSVLFFCASLLQDNTLAVLSVIGHRPLQSAASAGTHWYRLTCVQTSVLSTYTASWFTQFELLLSGPRLSFPYPSCLFFFFAIMGVSTVESSFLDHQWRGSGVIATLFAVDTSVVFLQEKERFFFQTS